VLVAAMAMVLAGCGDELDSIDALVQETCAGAAIDRDPATVFAAAEAYCSDGRTVTWFARTEDRDAWITLAESIAEDSGAPFVILDRGRYFTVHTEDAALPLRGRSGGTGGGDAALDALLDRCLGGDLDACVELYLTSPSGSDYEQRALDAIPDEEFLDALGSYFSEGGGGATDASTSGGLDPGGAPYSGTFALDGPDGRIDVDLFAGGSVTDGLPTGCSGSVGTRPDVVIEAGTDLPQVEITATPDVAGDLTLMVLTPDGRYLCDDDTRDLDPVVTIAPFVAGEYRLWVGTYDGEFTDASLRVTATGRL
jgi:hypothetical protein